MTIWDEFVQTLNEEINNLRVSLGNGSASDYAEYKQMVGTVHTPLLNHVTLQHAFEQCECALWCVFGRFWGAISAD